MLVFISPTKGIASLSAALDDPKLRPFDDFVRDA